MDWIRFRFSKNESSGHCENFTGDFQDTHARAATDRAARQNSCLTFPSSLYLVFQQQAAPTGHENRSILKRGRLHKGSLYCICQVFQVQRFDDFSSSKIHDGRVDFREQVSQFSLVLNHELVKISIALVH